MKNKENKNNHSDDKNINSNQSNSSNDAENQVDEKDVKIQQLEKEANEYKDRLLRKAAEFENYKRRTENDQLNLIRYAAENFIAKLLPVVDDFERSMIHINDTKDTEAVKDGIKFIYEKLMKILDDQGVKKIDAIGKPFDVHFHEAIMQRKAENTEPHIVLEEVEKGYMYKDRVIRHSKVIVSEELPEESSGNQDSENNINNRGEQ